MIAVAIHRCPADVVGQVSIPGISRCNDHVSYGKPTYKKPLCPNNDQILIAVHLA